MQAFLAAADRRPFWLVLEVVGVRLRAPAPDRGAEHVLRRPALPDRAARLDRARRARARRGSPALAALAAGALPGVLPYEHLISLNAVSDTLGAAPDLVAAAALVPDRAGCARRRRSSCIVRRRAVPVRAARATRSSCPALVLVYFAVSQKPIEGKHRHGVGRRALRGDHRRAPRLDRPRGRPRRAGGADLVGEHGQRTRSGRTRSSTAACGTSTTCARRSRATCPRQPLTVDRETGLMRGPTGRPCARRYVLTDSSVELGGRSSRQDARKGMFLYRTVGPLRQVSQRRPASTRRTRGRAATRTYTRLGCHGGAADGRAPERPGALHEADRRWSRRRRAGGGARARSRRRRRELLTVPLAATANRVCNVDFDGLADRRAGGRHQGRRTRTRASSARTSRRSRTRPP